MRECSGIKSLILLILLVAVIVFGLGHILYLLGD